MGILVSWSISKGEREHLRVDHHWGSDSFDGRGGLPWCDVGRGRGIPQSQVMRSLELCRGTEDEWLRLDRARVRGLESALRCWFRDVSDVGREETQVRTGCGLEEELAIGLTSCCVVDVVGASGARVEVRTVESH